MDGKDEKDDIAQGFEQKASKIASSQTSDERAKAAKRFLKAADRLAEEARVNGLTEDILAEILEEIDDEREKERVTKPKGKPDA